MADNIAVNENNGGMAFVSRGEVAWHGLGTVLPKEEKLTAAKCMKYGGMDYEVGIVPTHANIPLIGQFDEQGNQMYATSDVPKSNATYRKDTGVVLGTVGDRYTVVDNKDAFGFFDAITGGEEGIYQTAGVLGVGERIFITAKMPDYIRIEGTNDITEVYVLLTSSHDGTGAIKACVTPIRVVCNNTLRAALNNCTNKVSIRHTTNAKSALANAHKLMGITSQYAQEMSEVLNHLTTVKLSDAKALEIIEGLFPMPDDKPSTRTINIRNEVFGAYQSGTGQEGIVGSAYGLFNGITYYVDHLKSYKNQEVMLDNIMGGQGAKLVDQTMATLLSLS